MAMSTLSDRRRVVGSRGGSLAVAAALVWFSPGGLGAADLDFARDVRPLLEQRCFKCHGEKKQRGGLRLDSREAALRKADSGATAITPGHVDRGELLRRVSSPDDTQRMPPEGTPLSAAQIELLRRWIQEGAKWPDEPSPQPQAARRELVVTTEDRRHWAFQPLRPVEPPPVKQATWVRTPIDRFILAALEAKSLHPSAPASPRTLLRRISFDVIGLPPTPAEVQAFGAASTTNPRAALEALVDRRLASRHYGERWGRHWLDVARYADSDGLETDADRPHAYHYRDFVIRALNEDLSFQTFVRWQLAGDEYEPDNPQALAATGFLTGAPTEKLTDQHLEEERLRLRFNELDDIAVTTAAAFLGLTVGCARCHDHKFDAIPTRDYYRLQCAFTTTARDHVFLAPRAEVARYRAQEVQWQQRLQAAQNQLNDWLAGQKAAHTPSLRSAKIDALSVKEEEKRLLKEQPESAAAKRLAQQHDKALQLSEDDYRRVFTDPQRRHWDSLQKEVDEVQGCRPQAPPRALAITDKKAEPEATWLLERGDFYAKQAPVQLGFLTVLTGARTPEDYWAAARRESPAARSTGQRRALADWITDVEHGAGPLLARVIVNRVWQHHFGEGLVRTVNDFGVRGERPTHPELLEWLAHEFVAGGWRLKPLHRLILTSSVYQQDTTFDAARSQRDPENRLLWRRRPQRLEAEILRDAVLAVSGTLNPEPFGPAFKPPIPPVAIVARNTKDPYPKDARDTPATRRRTVYQFHKRVVQHPFLQAFDGPDASVSCGRRSTTTVAPQALALLNDTFFRDRAADFARRLLEEGGTNPAAWVARGYCLALARPPSAAERTASVQFLNRQLARRTAREPSLPPTEAQLQAVADFCQALFSLNEFIYVD
jgi:hypothetical protein